jgi:hypothetical protein
LNYINGVQRQRTNGQLTLQFKPVKELVTTLDYTYSENKIQTKRNELSAWFNFGPSASSWTGGPVSSPLIYKEFVTATAISPCAADFATKTQNKSLGFNAVWKPTGPEIQLDTHHSTAESGADSPFGSATTWPPPASAGNTTVDFSTKCRC